MGEFGTVTLEQLQEAMNVNCYAPMLITQAMVPLMQKAAKSSSITGLSCNKAAVMNITSKVGSIADNRGGKRYQYRASKVSICNYAITQIRDRADRKTTLNYGTKHDLLIERGCHLGFVAE